MTIEQDIEIIALRRQLEQSDNMCADILDMNIRLWRNNKLLRDIIRNMPSPTSALREAADTFMNVYTDSSPQINIGKYLLGVANDMEKENA